jgi:hypothetical protein
MESVGGIASFLSAAIFIMLAYSMRNQWTDSITREITKHSKDSCQNPRKIQDKIRTRVSYEGIYKLHDFVGFLGEQSKELRSE